MKETTNVNIGGQAFTADNDAYQLLNDYLDDVRSRITGDTNEIMSDIEEGIASILCEMLPSPVMVVTRSMVEQTIKRMGDPNEFGPKAKEASYEQPNNIKRLYRIRKDRVLAGVCGGIAKYFDFDASVMRLLTLALIVFGGLSFWVYVILWLIIPEEPLKSKFTKN